MPCSSNSFSGHRFMTGMPIIFFISDKRKAYDGNQKQNISLFLESGGHQFKLVQQISYSTVVL